MCQRFQKSLMSVAQKGARKLRGTSTPSASAAGTSSIYAVNIALDGFHGISPVGTGVINSYMPDMTAPGAVKKGEVELVAGVVLKNTLKAAALNGIVLKPKTGG